MYLARVVIKLRPSILDPQGKAVHHALQSLGMAQIEDVRMGKEIEMRINSGDHSEAERIAEEACRRLLANPVMEDFSFTLEKIF